MTITTKNNGVETRLPAPSSMFDTFFGPEVARSTFPGLTNFRRTMNTLLDNVLIPEPAIVAPVMDVYEKDGKYVLEAAIPGFKKEDINIEVVDNRLTVYGWSSEEKKEEEKGRYHYRELRRGSFSRSIAFPADINAEQVEATYENGILKVVVPIKPAPAKKVVIKG